jgi:alpha-methylacyl-CoA racemase
MPLRRIGWQMTMTDPGGPLSGIRVLELAALGPVPFCGMVLAGLGADVVRIDRARDVASDVSRPFEEQRGKRSVAIDMRHPDGPAAVLEMVDTAEVFLEGYRPGITEKMGIGPAECLERNPRLVYGRATGWGRTGPYAQLAGHDINYVAVSGLLGTLGEPGRRPLPPLNVMGDYASGGYGLALSVVAALHSAERTGVGQVVDVSMLETVALTTTRLHHEVAVGNWLPERGTNLTDGGAPFYNVYETSDGEHVAVGAVEPQFFAALLGVLGLDAALTQSQQDRSEWPRLKALFEERFRTDTRSHWVAEGARADACISPVLTPIEAVHDPHNVAVELFEEHDGIPAPRSVARFSRESSTGMRPPADPGRHTASVLREWGLSQDRIDALTSTGAVVDVAANSPDSAAVGSRTDQLRTIASPAAKL